MEAVKEVKISIEDLRHYTDNILKLQNFLLGHDTIPREKINEIKNTLEEGSDLNISIGNLFHALSWVLKGEIEKLEAVIDNTIINQTEVQQLEMRVS